MKTLSKESRNYILNLINDKENVNRIVSFCKGLGLDTTKYSSPVHISESKISIRYRNESTYYSI
jgi:hypothetical protein